MDVTHIGLTAIGLFLAGIVKGTTGLGFSSCALPFLVLTMGLKSAMAMVILPALATNISVAFTTGHLRESITRFGVLYLAMLPGIAVGVGLLIWVQQAVAVHTLGAVIVMYCSWSLLSPEAQLSTVAARRLQVPTGFVNGVLTGLTGSQVLPLFPYMMALQLDQARMVQAVNVAVLISSCVLMLGLVSTGIASRELVLGSLAAILPAVTGAEAGRRLREFIPARQFRPAILVVLFLTGAGMLIR